MLVDEWRLVKGLAAFWLQRRHLSLCGPSLKDYSSREARFMKKLMTIKPSKKRYYEDDRRSSVQSVVQDPSSQRRTPMRVSVLNKLFMTHVTDVLATGDLSEDILGKGLEVTSVAVSSDYQSLRVYWVAGDDENKTWLENQLPLLAHPLRHHLSQLYLIGSIPRISFHLDRRSLRLASVGALISDCDKGSSDDPIEEDDTPNFDDPIPLMTHNAYGINHDVISARIVKAVNKAKAPQRTKPPDEIAVSPSDPPETFYGQKESIRKFLLQRKLSDAKRYKKSKHDDLAFHSLQEEAFFSKSQDEFN